MAPDGDQRRLTVVALNYAPEHTGSAPYTAALVGALAGARDQVRVIAGYPHYPQWRIHDGYVGLAIRERSPGVHVTHLRHPVPDRPGIVGRTLMECVFGLRAAFSRWGRCDAVLLVSPALFSTGLAMVAARLRRIPTCVWVQDLYSLGIAETGLAGGRVTRLVRALEGRILRSADVIIAIHDRFEQHLVTELGVDPERVRVVRNWSHVAAPEVDEAERDAVRARLGWAPSDVVVLHAGNMGAKQGLENVVQAARIAAERSSAVRFVLLGDGNRRRELERAATATPGRLDFVDPLPDGEFEAALNAADVLLVNELPGVTSMSVPSKLTTYFRTGRPVVAATEPTGVTAQEVRAAGAGVIVSSSEPALVVDAAEALATDPEAARAYGASARRFAAEHLEASAATERIRELLHSVSRSVRSTAR